MFTATLYNETHFNLFNVPDSEAVLNSSATSTKSVPTMDILQLYYNSKIIVRAFESDVEHADFLKLTREAQGNIPAKSAFYVIKTYTMTSGDTVELSVDMEPFLTGGGVAALKATDAVLDGIVNRHHFPFKDTAAQQMNQLSFEEDPYFKPSFPTKIELQAIAFGSGPDVIFTGYTEIKDIMIAISTVDIAAANSFKYDVETASGLQTYVDAGLVGDTPINFEIPGIYDDQKYTTEDIHHSMYPRMAAYTGQLTYINSQSALVDFRKNLLKLNANNMLNIIQDCYVAPYLWVTAPAGSSNLAAGLSRSEFFHIFDLSDVTDIDGSKNIQAYCGKYNEFIFVASGSGAMKEVNIENMLKVSDSNEVKGVLNGFADPRPNGGINYAIGMLGTSYRNANNKVWLQDKYDILEGGKWYHPPIGIVGQTGINIIKNAFIKEQESKDLLAEISETAGLNPELNGGGIGASISGVKTRFQEAAAAGEGFGAVGAAFSSDYYGSFASGTGDLGRGVRAGNERAITAANRMAQKAAENARFNASNCPQPTVVSSPSGDFDMYDGAVFVFKRSLDHRDLEKFKEILRRFGVKHTTFFSPAYLDNRANYNYVECSGMSVNVSGAPKELNERIADALNTGLRIWHRKPNFYLGPGRAPNT